MSVCVTQELCAPPLRNSPVLEPACGQRSLFLPAQASPWGRAVFLQSELFWLFSVRLFALVIFILQRTEPSGNCSVLPGWVPHLPGAGVAEVSGAHSRLLPHSGPGSVRGLDWAEGAEPLNEGFRPGTRAWDPSDSKDISFVRIFFFGGGDDDGFACFCFGTTPFHAQGFLLALS